MYIMNRNNREICIPRLNPKESLISKKSVRFNPNVNVIEVESWKKYNSDMSKETEFYAFKKEYLALQSKTKKNRKKSNKNYDCNCLVFYLRLINETKNINIYK